MQEPSRKAAAAAGRRGSRARTLGSGLAVALGGAIVTGSILAASIAALNGWGMSRDALVLAAYLSALYGILYVSGLGTLAGIEALRGRAHGPRFFVGVLLGFAVFLSGILRFNPAIQLASVVPSLNWMGIIDLIGVGLASTALALAIITTDRKRRLAGLAVTVIGLSGLQALHVWHERPLRRDLAPLVAPLIATDSATSEHSTEPFEGARLVVLGFDGLTWENLLPLMERGELPHFQSLLRDSAYGYLETLPFAVSPVVWETINSGRSPEAHGIGHHVHFDFAGIGRRVAQLPGFRLCNTPMGVRRLLVATQRFAPWSAVTSSGLDARAARVWEIASKEDVRVGVFDWYNLGPVAPVDGFLRSRGAYPPNFHPPDLEEGFPELPPSQDMNPLTRAEKDPGISEHERALWQYFVAHALRHRPELLMYYTHYADGVNHLNWKYELVGPSLFFSGWRHPEFEPGPMVTSAHRLLDEIVGDVLSRLPDDAAIAILSDHGFDFRGYEHDNSPPGVVILRGPGIEPGLIADASVFDVAPTLLQLIDLPASEDMPGNALAAVRGDRIARVASYGAPLAAEPGGAVDQDELERQKAYLKSLGYVVD